MPTPRATARRYRELHRTLPKNVSPYIFKVELLAQLRGDVWGLDAAARPESLAAILRASRGSRNIVEIGTAFGWTAGALALTNPQATILTYDPVLHDRTSYLRMLPREARSRICPVPRKGDEGPVFDLPVDFLFIDGSHERGATQREFLAWVDEIRPGGSVVFHDYGSPDWPGVAEAIHDDLSLVGESEFDLFIWRKPDV